MDLRSAFPLTHRYLGSACPKADDVAGFVRAVCDQHAAGRIPERGVRDLVHYEACLLELPRTPEPAPGPAPREDEPCVLSDHVRILIYGADLPGMLAAMRAGRPAKPRPARGWLVMRPDGNGGVQESLILRHDGWFLEAFREPTPPADAIGGDETERAKFHAFWAQGLLARAKR